MSSVSRVRASLDPDESGGADVDVDGGRSADRPTTAASRRDSLHQLVRPASVSGEDHEAKAEPPTDAAAAEEVRERKLARSLATSPIPGVVDSSLGSTSTKRREALHSGETLPAGPRYTTTLEEDDARDAAAAAAARAADAARDRAEFDRERAEAAESFSALGFAPARRASQSHRRKPSSMQADDSMPEPFQRRASFAQVDSPDGVVEPAALLPGAIEIDAPLIGQQAVSSDDLIQPVHVRRISQSVAGSELGRQRRKYHPEEVDGAGRPAPSPPPAQDESSEGEESDEEKVAEKDGLLAGAPVSSDEVPARPSRSKTPSKSRSNLSAHGEEEPTEDADEPVEENQPASPSRSKTAASPSPVADDDADDAALPAFVRPERRYAPIADPMAELERIRATKDFEDDFDDIMLPTFAASHPTSQHDSLTDRFDEVRALIAAEAAAPVAALDESALLEEILGVGRLSLEEAARMERELEIDRLEEVQEELQRAARRELELASFQHALLEAHEAAKTSNKKELAEREHQMLQSTRLLLKEEQESFRRAEDRMRAWLSKKKNATLSAEMQDLLEAPEDREKKDRAEKELREREAKGIQQTDDEQLDASRKEIQDLYARVRSRKYEIHWNYEPRLIRIRLDWLRCIKNKLPLGNYNIMVTLYDRLGGDALRWSTGAERTDGEQPSTCFSHTGATTMPQRHDGKFYNLDLTFNQRANRIFLACPSMVLSRPSMVFVFELFLMGDQSTAPVRQQKRGSVFQNVVSGITGKGSAMAQEMVLKARDPAQYALLKAAQANAAKAALDRAPPSSDRVVAWGAFPMAHINFEIIKGQFKVPLLRGSYADDPLEKFETIHEKIATNLDHWLANLYFDVRHWPRLRDNAQINHVQLNFKGKKLEQDAASSDEEEDEETVIEDGALVERKPEVPANTTGDGLLSVEGLEPDILVLDQTGVQGMHSQSGNASAPQNSQNGARGDHAIDLGSSFGLGSRTESKASTRSVKSQKKKRRLAPSNHAAVTSIERRMKIKLHTRRFPGMLVDIPDLDEKAAADLRNQKKRAEICSQYRYHVNLKGEDEGTARHADSALGRLAAYKMRYIANEIWADLGVKKFRDWQFFFFLIFASLWVRVFMHYLGQYLFLSSIYVPVTEWSCMWYACNVVYVWDPQSVSTTTQIGMTVIGVVANMVTFGALIGLARLIQLIIGRTPAWTSRMLLGWGCGTIFEPLLILIIDVCRGNWYGDSFKLYQYYYTKDGNGISGLFMTILLSMLLVTASVIMFYHYIVHIHMHGRILDVHYRLHGGADRFHIPHDLEISVRELRWTLIKASRWVGMGGQKRKITVSKFRVRDPLRRDASQTDLSIYIAIYTQSLNGDIELFRHFVRSPSGSIVEMFDSFEIPGEDSFKRIEEKLTAHEKRVASIANLSLGDFSKLQNLSTGGSSKSVMLPPQQKSRSLTPAPNTPNMASHLGRLGTRASFGLNTVQEGNQ